MKNIFKFAAVALLALAFAHAEHLKVGTNAVYPPFEFINDQNKITGFDIDLVDALSKKVGFTYEIVNMSFDGLIPALKAGKIDAIASGMSATAERAKAVDFIDPYFNTTNIFIKKADNDAIKTKADLAGKKIAVQIGTVQEAAAKEIKDANVMVNEDVAIAVMALKTGKADALLTDNLVGVEYIKKNPDLVAFLTEPDGSEGFSIAFNKNKKLDLIAKINAALKQIKASGEYDKLLAKYNLK